MPGFPLRSSDFRCRVVMPTPFEKTPCWFSMESRPWSRHRAVAVTTAWNVVNRADTATMRSLLACLQHSSRCRYEHIMRGTSPVHEGTLRRGTDMLRTILIIIVILMLLGSLPTWPYSSGWGYYPSGGLGLVLLILVILILADRL